MASVRFDPLKGVDVSIVSRGDSTLRGHFPGDLAALEAGMGGEEFRGENRADVIVMSLCVGWCCVDAKPSYAQLLL